jgi:hypothetical protein
VDDLKFKALIDAYGGDVERWPAAERAAARTRVAQARADDLALLREAGALDALLGEARCVVAPAALVGRLLQSAQGSARGSTFSLGGQAPTRLAAAALLLVALGVFAGWTASHDAVAAAAGDALLASVYDEAADELFAVGEL